MKEKLIQTKEAEILDKSMQIFIKDYQGITHTL